MTRTFIAALAGLVLLSTSTLAEVDRRPGPPDGGQKQETARDTRRPDERMRRRIREERLQRLERSQRDDGARARTPRQEPDRTRRERARDGRGLRMERRDARVERRGERMNQRGQRLERRGQRLERRGQRLDRRFDRRGARPHERRDVRRGALHGRAQRGRR